MFSDGDRLERGTDSMTGKGVAKGGNGSWESRLNCGLQGETACGGKKERMDESPKDAGIRPSSYDHQDTDTTSQLTTDTPRAHTLVPPGIILRIAPYAPLRLHFTIQLNASSTWIRNVGTDCPVVYKCCPAPCQ